MKDDTNEKDNEIYCCYGHKHDWVAVWKDDTGRWHQLYYDTEEQAKNVWGNGVVPPNGCVFRYRY